MSPLRLGVGDDLVLAPTEGSPFSPTDGAVPSASKGKGTFQKADTETTIAIFFFSLPQADFMKH